MTTRLTRPSAPPALLVLSLLAAFGGCTLPPGSSYGRPCADDGSCPDGYRCWADTCVPDDFGDRPGDDGGAPSSDAGDDDAGTDAGSDAGPLDGGTDGGEGDAGPEPHPWCNPANVMEVDLGAAATYEGDTREGFDALIATACHLGPTREQVLRFVAPTTGTLHFELESQLDLGLVVFDHCEGASDNQRACFEHAHPGFVERGRITLESGEAIYLAVDGFDFGDEAPWSLTFDFVSAACGNGHADPGEECDTPEPWCQECRILEEHLIEGNEASGDEPNDSHDVATVYPGVGPAFISPISDVDVYRVDVPYENAALTARVRDTFGGSACLDRQVLAPRVEIVSPTGDSVLARALGTSTSCPVAHTLVGPGTHYVRVQRTTAVDYNSADEFPYVLDINVFIPTCGNGVLEVGEQCDDGNLTPGDGCDDLCLFERVGETEPNAGPAQPGATPPARGNDFDPALAEGPFSDSVVITGTISPVGDEDGFKLLHAGPDPRQVTARILHPFGPYAECDPSSFDLMLHLVDEDGHVLKTGDTPAEIGCDELRFELPANVARYLHVHEYGDNAVVPTYYLQIEFE